MALCESCRDFDIQSFHRDTFYLRGHPLMAVICSAEAGCSFCSLLLDSLSAANNGNQPSYLSLALRRRTKEPLPHIPWLSQKALTLLYRHLYLIISPAWVHFNVMRADDCQPAWMRKDGLNIRSLGAHVSNSVERYGLIHKRGDTQRVHFQVAADEGRHCSTRVK